MAYTAKIQNPQGEVLQLNDQEDKWSVLNINGLDPAPSVLNTNQIYGMDGERMNSAKIGMRNIVILLKICGDCDANREELYRFFPQKIPIRFFYKTSRRDMYVDGYVETIGCPLFEEKELFQASLLCPDPYLRDVAETVVELENSQSGFEFPFAINYLHPIEFGTYEAGRTTEVINDTQTETPFEIEITPRKNLVYFDYFMVQNILTGEKIGFSGWPNDDGFCVGDVIRISTDPYHPTITLQHGATIYNRISALIPGATFFSLHPGRNLFAYDCDPATDAEFLDINLKFRKKYRGV